MDIAPETRINITSAYNTHWSAAIFRGKYYQGTFPFFGLSHDEQLAKVTDWVVSGYIRHTGPVPIYRREVDGRYTLLATVA